MKKNKGQKRTSKARVNGAEVIRHFKELFANNKNLLGVRLLRLWEGGGSDIVRCERDQVNERGVQDQLTMRHPHIHIAAICHQYSDMTGIELMPDVEEQLEQLPPEIASEFSQRVIEQLVDSFELPVVIL